MLRTRRALNWFLVSAALLTIGGTASAEREAVDRIAAIVGDRVILASELASQIQWTAFQGGEQPRTEREIKALQKRVLDQMISDQLFLIAAKKDTAIAVRPEEVEQALDERIQSVTGNFPSYEAFLGTLEAEGMTLRDLRKRYRPEVENQLIKQRFISKKLSSVSISRHEVEQFYRDFRDSIPNQPEAVKLAHILLQVKPAQAVEDSVRTRAEELRQMVLDGADFAAISSQYSSLGAGANGGDLGYISRDDVVEEFARAAFQLLPGDISEVVRTQFGYHVITCEGRHDDRLKLRHILLAVSPGADDTARVVDTVDSLRQAVGEGAAFEELAKEYSTDDASRATGGELGWFAVAQMPKEFSEAVTGWTTPGEVRGPVFSQYGVHVLKLLEYQPEKQYTLEEDFDTIKELARQDKTGKQVDKWIEELRKETYIDSRLADL